MMLRVFTKPLLVLAIFVCRQTLFAGDISFYGIFKEQDFLQTNNTAPVSDTSRPYVFQCVVDSSAPNLISSASVQLPGGGSRTLQPDGDHGFAFREIFSSAGALNASYGVGSYTLMVDSENDGFNFAQLSVPADAYPNTPQMTNFTAAQAINPSNAFTLAWQPFSGGTANDFIELKIRDSSSNTTVFRSGDFGTPGALNGTNLSIVLPANTLSPGEIYFAGLLFSKLTAVNNTSIPGATGLVAFLKRTTVHLQTAGSAPAIHLNVIGFSSGNFQFSFNTQPGKNYQIQFADALPNWQNLQFTNAASSEIIFTDTFASFNPARFYRVTAP